MERTNDQNGTAKVLRANAFFFSNSLGASRSMKRNTQVETRKVERRTAKDVTRMAGRLARLALCDDDVAREASSDRIEMTNGGMKTIRVGMTNVGSSRRRWRRKDAVMEGMGEQM
mmetsp:Transcript_23076/g.48651  ORF Transcript_23076/g.48651 Transcript_23076/m.48651 type:complete len:115 (-) Transcript_23076:390-734(-)